MANDQCYFDFIQTFNLLKKYLEEKQYNLLFSLNGKLEDFIVVLEDSIEKGFLCSLFVINLIILYLYFSNYPYLYGVLTDEEINQIFPTFKSNMNKSELESNIVAGYNSLINIVEFLANKVDKSISIIKEKEHLKIFHRLLIEIVCSFEQLYQDINIEKLSKYYQIKNYFRDIDFCLGKFMLITFYYCNLPLSSKISKYFYSEERIRNYIFYILHLKKDNIAPENEQEKNFNNAIKYNDTIVIGDKNFHDIMNKMNLPGKNKYYLNEKEILNFFKEPKEINNKYNVCKYLIIMNEKNGIEYLETINYISNNYILKIVLIIYIRNKNINIDKKILQSTLVPIILTYSEKDILNYYNDHFDRLKEKTIKYFDRNEFLDEAYGTSFKFSKLNEIKIAKEEDNGWDMKRDINVNIFDSVKVETIFGGCFRTDIFIRNMYKVCKENNCLDLYFNYYGNYFGVDHIVEEPNSILTFCKMFLYAYTLEEKNGKSFYSLMNNDLPSGDSEKICRYLPMIREIYDMVREGFLKSYSGDVYRATYFKKELTDEIKPGVKMLNVSFWSSSKKLSVAKKFLFEYKKNILLHTKVKKGNNIDIHLENLSQFPSEEEILIFPYCYFEIKSFKKVKENNFKFYDLELIYCEEQNSRNKIENVKYHEFYNLI